MADVHIAFVIHITCKHQQFVTTYTNYSFKIIKSTVNHLNEMVESSTCLISKTALTNIYKPMLYFLNCHENA